MKRANMFLKSFFSVHSLISGARPFAVLFCSFLMGASFLGRSQSPDRGGSSPKEGKVDSLKERMYEAREEGNMERYEKLKGRVQELNGVGKDEENAPPQDEVDKVKEEMYAAREEGNMKRFRTLRDSVQKMNGVASDQISGTRDSTKRQRLKERMYEAREAGNMERYRKLQKKVQRFRNNSGTSE